MADFAAILHQMPIYLLQAHGAAESHTPGLWERILHSNVINVVLVVLILGFLIKKNNLFKGIDDTREKIATEVETVEQQKQQVLAQLEEAKRRTANLNAEVEELLKNARESAETLSAQIIADARGESAKLIENAKHRLELEQRAAAKELERRLLSDALADARQELTRSLTPADQARSVEAFLNELSQVKGGRS